MNNLHMSCLPARHLPPRGRVRRLSGAVASRPLSYAASLGNHPKFCFRRREFYQKNFSRGGSPRRSPLVKEYTMRNFILAVLALCLFCATAFAQGGQGSLSGSVAGPDGNIAGATITAKDNQTGKEQTVQASSDGTFTIASLEVGTYTVTVTAPGFKTNTITNVKIDAGRPYSLNAVLEVGNIS